MIKKHFKKIGIVGRLNPKKSINEKIAKTVRQLCQLLDKEKITFHLDANMAQLLTHCNYPVANMAFIGETCDLAIVIGGDGSFLVAAKQLCSYGTPLLGINRGRLGFLTDVLPHKLESQIMEVISGKFGVEERFLITAQLCSNGHITAQEDALNDVVLHAGKAMGMIEFSLYIDDHFVYIQRSDGLIISTPTGSTAYGLSAGGPIMHPDLDALVLVPMHPHTLGSRPIVVKGSSVLKLIVSDNNRLLPRISCDGQPDITTQAGDCITISKKKNTLHLIHPSDHNYYEVCRTKLGWKHHLGDYNGN